MKRLLAVGLVLLALGSCAGVSLGERAYAPGEPAHALSTAGEFDSVQFRITTYENGSAKWTFRYQRTLANETERQQFQEFASQFNEEETALYSNFQSQARALTAAGANATGREMEAIGFGRSASIDGLDQNLGVVRMSFVWTNFAASDGDRLIIGDVFQGGLYIGPNQSLVIERSDGLVFAEALPEPTSLGTPDSLAESQSVTWEGEQEFADHRPRIVFEPAPQNTTTPGTDPTETSSPGTDTDTGTDPGTTVPTGEGSSSVWPMVGAAFLLIVGLVAALLWYGTDDFDPAAGDLLSGDDGPDGPPGGSEEGPSPPSVPEEELLTDDARVLQLLEENGGRMKQVNIVEETGWSKSKVSMLLSEMDDEGEINKLRMGRENIISLDGHEPDAARSPFEED